VALLSDNTIERLERSKAYLIFDWTSNWIFEGVGGLLLFACSIHWWNRYSERGPDPRFYFWLKVLLLSIALFSVKWAKDEILAWMGIAPPDQKWIDEKLFGKQLDMAGIDPTMDLIIQMQYRATRIRQRGIRVDQLLVENEAIFRRKQGKLRMKAVEKKDLQFHIDTERIQHPPDEKWLKFKHSMRMIGAFGVLYALVWVFGEHGHSYFLEPTKQTGIEWTCPTGQDGPFWDNRRGRDPVCHVPVRDCPMLLFPVVTQSPCPYRDFLGGRWTDDDEFVLQQMKYRPFF
jgi:hypothetical protein